MTTSGIYVVGIQLWLISKCSPLHFLEGLKKTNKDSGFLKINSKLGFANSHMMSRI